MRRGLSENLAAARAAISHVREMLPHGAGNKTYPEIGWFEWAYTKLTIDGLLVCDGPMKRDLESTAVAGERAQGHHEIWIAKVADVAKRYRMGNCGAQSAVAFEFLSRRGHRPLDFMELRKVDHTFVVVGRRPMSSPASIDAWGEDAVICDPWDRQAYPAWEATHRMMGRPNLWPVSVFRKES